MKRKVQILIPLSGGKDSQAAMLWAIEHYGLENCQSIFCDVKWEADETYKHVDYLVKKTGIKHNVVTSKKYDGMIDMAVKRGRFPSSPARFCTQELKIFPMIDFILSLEQHIFVIDGVRADESLSRSLQNKECRFFKYYFQPYKSNSMTIEKYSLKPPTSLNQKKELEKAIQRLAIGKEDEKFFTYRKKEVIAWCKKYADDLIRPFFNSTANDVIKYSLERGYDINPLYYQGDGRVGCEPCVMSNLGQIKVYVFDRPKVIEKIRAAEIKTGSSFFAPDKIPKRYHSQKTEANKSYPNIDDIVRYIMDKNATGDLFEQQSSSIRCKSIYNICE